MCEFLMMNRDRWSGDELQHLADFKKDDPVNIYPDGVSFTGKTLDSERFWILKVPGFSVETGRRLLEMKFDSLTGQTLVKKRKYKFDRGVLSAPARAYIDNNAQFTLSGINTITDLKNYIKLKSE